MLRMTKTETGLVRGLRGTDPRITVYKGIPFAADPVGENRWRAPQPAPAWEGVRNCFEYAPITMQEVPGEDPEAFYSKEWHVDPEIPMGEAGSLALNIWTPAKTGDEKLPVMVWIFGGGLQCGYTSEMEFDGERIASRGVILVSVAYRLNVFGFLCHPEITAENPDAPGNFGYLDQKAGIEWVRRNIANFGGDPENITIFGQSSGGVSVFSQMCSPQTDGLFQRAIIESSAAGSVIPAYPSRLMFRQDLTLREAEEQGVRFLREHLGVETLAEARKLDAKFIEEKSLASGLRFTSVIDGKFMEKSITRYVFDNDLHRVPFFIGYTGDEVIMGAENPEAWIPENLGPYAQDYLALCRKEAGDAPLSTAAAVNLNDLATHVVADVCSAQGRKVYCYNFDPEIPGDDAGSFHSCDLWFQFETLMKCWRPFDGHHFDLARKMCNYWTNFAKTGDPNGSDADGTPMPEWSPYTQDSRRVIQFFDEISMEKTGPSESKDLLIKANIEALKSLK